jgi:hypothetical protein
MPKKKSFILHLKGRERPNDPILGCTLEETDAKLMIKDEQGETIASFNAAEMQ